MDKEVHLVSSILQLNSFLSTLGELKLLLFGSGNTLSISLCTAIIKISIRCFKALLRLNQKEFTLTKPIVTAGSLYPYSL
jgi:hypothetical protein